MRQAPEDKLLLRRRDGMPAPSPVSGITTIGFDADDTLWHNERFFRITEEQFNSLLTGFAPPEDLSQKLLEAEKRNLDHYGFGIKGYTLSMIETAIEVTQGRVSANVIAEILALGRELLRHPIEPLPFVRETLEGLAGQYRLLLITKGDLFDQERKLAQSGLGELFDAIEIVSSKVASTYQTIFARHGEGPGQSAMVGNSLKSDVLPAIEAGAWGIYVPQALIWALDRAEEPTGSPRFKRIRHLGELPRLLSGQT